MLVSKLNKERILAIARYNVKKFFSKPIKIDSLIRTVSELLDITLEIDNTPCIIDAHFNDGIIFIEVARGLNMEKIDLLKYKITEILKLYGITTPKVLIIMTDVQVTEADRSKFNSFLQIVHESTQTPLKGIKILTSSDVLKKLLKSSSEFGKIELTNDINQAMDKLYSCINSILLEKG